MLNYFALFSFFYMQLHDSVNILTERKDLRYNDFSDKNICNEF